MDGDGPAVVALRKDLTEKEAIRACFRLGYTNSQLCAVLEHCHGIQLTIDQVKKRLVKLDLRRRRLAAESSLQAVEAAIRVSCTP